MLTSTPRRDERRWWVYVWVCVCEFARVGVRLRVRVRACTHVRVRTRVFRAHAVASEVVTTSHSRSGCGVLRCLKSDSGPGLGAAWLWIDGGWVKGSGGGVPG